MIAAAAHLRHHAWRTVFRCTGGFQVVGALPPGGCVVVANHCSHADAPLILAAVDAAHRPVVAAAADYWFDRPAKAWLCRSLVAGFPVRRHGGGYTDLAAQLGALAAGRAVVIFPAGSRRAAGARFREGAFRLAQQSRVPVVPIRLTGTAALLSPGSRPRRATVSAVIDEPITVTEPAADAQRVRDRLDTAAPSASPAPAGLRARLAALAAAPTGALLAFGWALAEGISWPVMSELLVAALVLSGPRNPLRAGLRLAGAAAVGSAVGGTITLLLARHGVIPPHPMTTPAMLTYASDQLAAHGLPGLGTQPLSGIPYKVYSRAAAATDASAASWFAMSAGIRSLRLVLVALLASAVQRLTVRWQHLYTRSLAAGVLTFVAALCLIATSWSGPHPTH